MKNNLLLCLILLASFSCNMNEPTRNSLVEPIALPNEGIKDVGRNNHETGIYGKWMVMEMQMENGQMQEATAVYTLEIPKGDEFRLMLDVNSCGGTKMIEGSRIKFAEVYCTEACCDSPFAQSLTSALLRASAYSIEQNKLIISGERKIVFQKYNASLYGSWELQELEAEGKGLQPAETNYIISIDESNRFGFKLDVNNCGGEYALEGNQISFQDLVCTYICCDSQFANNFLEVLQQVNSYKIEGEKLMLLGEKMMVFKKIK